MIPTLASGYIPSVIGKTEKSERAYDIFSRLLKDRVIFLCGEVNDAVSELIVAQMLFLEAEDPNKDGTKEHCYQTMGSLPILCH